MTKDKDFSKLDKVFTKRQPIKAVDIKNPEKETDKSARTQKKELIPNKEKYTSYYDAEKKKKIEEIAFFEEKPVYLVIDEALTDYLKKKGKL